MRYAREELSTQLVEEMRPLLEMHSDETNAWPDIAFKLDIEPYVAFETAGMLRVFTARDDTNTLLGYVVITVGPHPQYAGSVQASTSAVFMHPRIRGTASFVFLSWCDAYLKAEGVQVVYHSVKTSLDWSPLLLHMGYGLHEVVYARRLN